MGRLFRILAGVACSCLVLLLVIVTFAIAKRTLFGKDKSGKAHVAVLELSGVIMGSSSLVRDLEEQLESKSVKAIVLRINSPGGVVGPSQELYEAFRKADQKIPVIVSMGSLAASGGYYTALAGRKIFANPGTLTASIGVIMEFANLQKLYQWAKMERYTLKAGKFKDVGSPFREMLPPEKELLTSMLTDIHKQFRDTVRARRKVKPENFDNCTDGRVMTGQQAFEMGLVDQLGGLEEAIADAKKTAGLPSDAPVVYPEAKGFLSKFIEGDDNASGSWKGLANVLAGNYRPHWRVMLLAPVE